MSTVQEIEAAIAKLSEQELATLRAWFREFDAAVWDRQFDSDVKAGNLDNLADEALRELREKAGPRAPISGCQFRAA